MIKSLKLPAVFQTVKSRTRSMIVFIGMSKIFITLIWIFQQQTCTLVKFQPYVVKCMLQYYIAKGSITVDVINSRLMEFRYGYSQVKDKPEPINPESLTDKPGKHIAKDAAKMWMLFRVLPFILHDIIDESHKPFEVFQLLMKISSLLLAPVLSCESVSLLQRMTAKFLTNFKNVFHKQITPKMHYLVHCPRLILLCGPLVRLWNMRFEAKHKDFKRIAKNASF